MTKKAIQTLALAVLGISAVAETTLAQQPSWGWDAQLQGGFLWRRQYTPPVMAEAVDITGPSATGTETINPTNNWTVRASLRRRLASDLDIGFAYTGIGSTDARRTSTSVFPVAMILPGLISSPITSAAGGFAIDARSRVRQHVADIDVGFGGEGAGPKFTAGFRFTHFSQRTRIELAQGFFPAAAEFEHRRDDRFIGAGPRIAGQWTHTLAEGWSAVAGAEGSALFGSQRFRTTTTGLGGLANGAYNEEHGRAVLNAGGEFSLVRAWTNGTYAAIGYQASAWFGLRDNRRELDAAKTLAGGAAANLLGGGRRYPIDFTHGPFLRFGVRL